MTSYYLLFFIKHPSNIQPHIRTYRQFISYKPHYKLKNLNLKEIKCIIICFNLKLNYKPAPKAAMAWTILASSKGLACICRPTGTPLTSPAFMLAAGIPARLAITVKTS